MKKRARKKTSRKKKAARKSPRKAARKATRKSPRKAARKPSKPRKPKKPKKPKKARKPKKPGASRKGPPAPKPVHDTVVLSQPSGPDHVPHLSRSRKDRVRWRNDDVQDHTLTFTIWPFVQPSEPILVPAGKHTKWFSVDPGTVTRTYSYGISPPFPNQGPPDPPEVVVDG